VCVNKCLHASCNVKLVCLANMHERNVCVNKCLHGCCNEKLVCLANMHERKCVCKQLSARVLRLEAFVFSKHA